MDCIDFSTNQVMRPFGAAKAKPSSPPKFTMPKALPMPMPKQMPIAGGVKLIPRVSPITPRVITNPYIDMPKVTRGKYIDRRDWSKILGFH